MKTIKRSGVFTLCGGGILDSRRTKRKKEKTVKNIDTLLSIRNILLFK